MTAPSGQWSAPCQRERSQVELGFGERDARPLCREGEAAFVKGLSERTARVESRRSAHAEGGGSSGSRRLSSSCRCLSLPLDPVASPRSSKPACGFPASGNRSRSSLRSRETALPQLQAFSIVVLPQSPIREAHGLPRLHLVRPAQPPAQPLDGAASSPQTPLHPAVRVSLRFRMQRFLVFPDRIWNS